MPLDGPLENAIIPLGADEIDALCERINSEEEPDAVVITVSGGVTEIAQKPKGTKVVIWDYDVQKEMRELGRPNDFTPHVSDAACEYSSISPEVAQFLGQELVF
ncbi:hypothetical protein KGP36_01780 [Patescibacteria group bacterium]|nr:hypothetical protein [Patescibacteria group bacterium]